MKMLRMLPQNGYHSGPHGGRDRTSGPNPSRASGLCITHRRRTERERERSVCVCVCIYIYMRMLCCIRAIYTYVYRALNPKPCMYEDCKRSCSVYLHESSAINSRILPELEASHGFFRAARIRGLGLTQGLLCSSFLGLLWFFVRDYSILPKRNYIGGSG